ncbi:hypothetical protein QVD17_03084 [Tagetes erecta]|uniref:Uncharacterized protein n=1 Tax=Tagetes erecta TaxID=13708 RepID=A0AAD8L7R5_TARER|nr:hypothetical protein QVD17_03084 [Tagetes erecta]
MKIQPIDCTSPACFEPVKIVPVPKSRLKRLFDFSSFLRGSTDRSVAGESQSEIEPSSVCLDKMVQNFIEENNEKQCNCVNGNCYCSIDGCEDEFDSFNCFGNSISHSSFTDACDSLKSLVVCERVFERNLLDDVAKIVDKNKICKKKDESSRKIVADGLLAAGYSVSICTSRWEKTRTYPAGEYEYIDAMIEGDRVIIDIDFRSEFEIARSTKSYRSVLQMLPHIFVGRPDRLQNIINIVSDAAKQSLKKKGMPLPPWRRADYVKAKWLSPCNQVINKKNESFNEIAIKPNMNLDPKDVILMDESADEAVKQWEPLEIKPKVLKTGGKVVSGLASVIEGK